MRRLIEFASDTAQLADQRPDLELRELIDVSTATSSC